MQHMQAIGDSGGNGGGRFIGVGDRRLRPHNHPNHQSVKCPRCDSFNTKFCYYNNYNLSQPRYFCKSCRRYWTKGGILRNVPVGGGCRKAKRSKAKSSASSACNAPRESKSNGQSSSSESSSLTAAVAVADTTPSAVAEEGSAPINTTSSSTVMFNFPNSSFTNVDPQANSSDHQPLMNYTATDAEIYPTDMGSFTSLMTSSEEMMNFGMSDIPTTSYGSEQPVNQAPRAENLRAAATADELKMEDMSNDGLTAALDWGTGDDGRDHGLFDLTAGVDQAYWNQSEWTDSDQYLR